MEEKITIDQAYDAMFVFLRNFLNIGSFPGELRMLLTGMELLERRKTSDPAFWHDWEKAVREALSKGPTYISVR